MTIEFEALQSGSYDPNVINEIVRIDGDAFGKDSLTPWVVESFLRYGMVFLLRQKGKIIAVAELLRDWNDHTNAYVVGVTVETPYQNKGYGTFLLKQILQYLSDHGFESLDLHVNPLNIRAVHIYGNKLGFKSIAYHKNEYGDGGNRILMRRSLKGASADKELLKLSEKSCNISRTLRQAFFSTAPKIDTPYQVPFGGTAAESLGPWPEFIIKTYPCTMSMRGYCTPCFYSKVPLVNATREQVLDSILVQLDHILQNFETDVMASQEREVEYPGFPRRFGDGRPAILCVACNGSFFSDTESSREHRWKVFSRLDDFARANHLNLQVFTESCAEDILEAYKKGELQELGVLLTGLNAGIMLGFESKDELVRNGLYNKRLPLHTFEMTVEVVRSQGLVPAAFVYPGFYSMTSSEIIADVKATLGYLKQIGCVPVLMFPNLQQYTILDLLYSYDKYNLPDPRTMLELVLYMTELFERDEHQPVDPWLTGDPYGGPPSPYVNVFSNPRKISCARCSSIICESVKRFRKNYNRAEFIRSVKEVDECDCKKRYDSILQETDPDGDLFDRAWQNLEFAEGKMKYYLINMRKA